MPLPKTIDVCRVDLFTPLAELTEKYDAIICARVMRVRDEYQWMLANPDARDRQFVEEFAGRYSVSDQAIYADLAIIKQLMPALSAATRDFHRWKTNQMLLETYQMARKRKDAKTMERAATSYGKLNRVDLEDEQAMPFDLIVVQPFTATQDPSVLGIKPIPNIDEKISRMIEKYRAETIDIDDVEYEEADLEEGDLWRDDEPDGTAQEGNIL
ncbi:MAG: hypothetical protein IKT03_05725 [Muribaculaceae bacterium]|nr:hypothetical protein [Muribaculaceae bacterium]MBR5030842.1 hypothetical protein [Muribaculaceae bacterium]MBR6490018.1 hypothetical protein [Muribaculaceae bacterium]